jgi:murein DD-endopeptidase MepM/ murein hydrolase activator NlpD
LTFYSQEHLFRQLAMDKMPKNYTIIIIPDRNDGKSVSLCVSKTVIVIVIALVFVFAGAATLLLFESAAAAKKLQYFNTLRKDNEFLKKENEQFRLINNKIARIDSLAEYLERLTLVSQTAEKNRGNNKTIELMVRGIGNDTGKSENQKKTFSGIVTEHQEPPEINTKSTPMALPVEGWITQQFIDDTTQGTAAHPGIDIAAEEGMIIKAPAPGIVTAVETDQYYGNLIVIKHNEEFSTRYGHCAKVFVIKGEKIEQGQTIALVGNTGHSTAPHLHYEVIRKGKNVNPLQFVSTDKK